MKTTEHTRTVAAAPEVLYDLVADVTAWPALFGPSVHVRHLERSERSERFQLWASVHDEVVNWVSRRTLDPDGLRVLFAQEVSRPPVESMGGEWLFRALPGGRTEVVLRHHFTAADEDRVIRALDHNSTEELAALARVAECGRPVSDVLFSFTDTAENTAVAGEAYAFVAEAGLWADRLPHVGRVRLTELANGVQDLEMDTVTADGASHTTRSVRVCQAPEWIAYKQRVTPELLWGHSGLWTFDDGVVTSTHTVLLNPALAGPETRDRVRDALSRNSSATLAHAAAFSRTAAGPA